jgi:acyl-CoA synthetase (AMP-forming)/AMP-acid ligase II
MGFIGALIYSMFLGCLCVFMPPLAFLHKPLRWLEAIARYRGTHVAAPSFAYDLCVRRSTPEQRAALDLSCLRLYSAGGEPINSGMIERFISAFAPSGVRGEAFFSAYGLAEFTVFATGMRGAPTVLEVDAPSLASGRAVPPEQPSRARGVTLCGHPWGGNEVAIVDPERGERVPDGRVGEIWLCGESMAMGYWRRPERTEQAFGGKLNGDARRWLRTGDLGFMTPQGVAVSGRIKDLIIVRGANYDPLDIESCLVEIDAGFGRKAAFSIETDRGEAVVLAYEIGKKQLEDLDIDALTAKAISAVNARLGLALHDFAVVQPGALPHTISGKVQRSRCRELYQSGRLPMVGVSRHAALGRWRASA